MMSMSILSRSRWKWLWVWRLSRWSWPGGEAGDGEGDGEDTGEVGAGQLWWLHAGHCATNMLLVAVMPECRRATDSCDSQLLCRCIYLV